MGDRHVSYAIRKQVDPQEEGKISRKVNYSGKVSTLRVEFPPGQESQLQLTVFLRSPSGRVDQLVFFADDGEEYMAGSGTEREMSPNIPCYEGDSIDVHYTSVDDEFTRDLIVDVEIRVTSDE